MADGLTLIPNISQNTGISSGFSGISLGSGISGNNPAPPGPARHILTEAGDFLVTEAGDQLITEN